MNPILKSPTAGHSKKASSKETLEIIFQGLLKDLYWAEKHLVSAMPKMVKASYNDSLREAIESHHEETQKHLERLEKCFAQWEIKPVAKKCEAMEGLIKEAAEVVSQYDEGHARDAALIAAIQKIEHYEISTYGTLRTMSTVMGNDACAKLLEESKMEEVSMDADLTKLAERINREATEPTNRDEVSKVSLV